MSVEGQEPNEALERLEQREREYRNKHFEVKVEVLSQYQIYPDEVYVSITYNGKQWQSTSLNKREALILIEALVKHFELKDPVGAGWDEGYEAGLKDGLEH